MPNICLFWNLFDLMYDGQLLELSKALITKKNLPVKAFIATLLYYPVKVVPLSLHTKETV